jgi:hypothetical protein
MVFTRQQVLDSMVGANLEPGILDHRLPEMKQGFLGGVGHPQVPVERDSYRFREQELVPGVLADRIRKVPLLEDHVVEVRAECLKPGAQARGSGPDYGHVVNRRRAPVGAGGACNLAGNVLDRDLPFVYRVLDQSPASQFADNVHAGEVALEGGVDQGNFDSLHGISLGEGNGSHGAGLHALAVGDTHVPIHDGQLSHELYGAGFRAGVHAGPAPDAHVLSNQGVQGTSTRFAGFHGRGAGQLEDLLGDAAGRAIPGRIRDIFPASWTRMRGCGRRCILTGLPLHVEDDQGPGEKHEEGEGEQGSHAAT